MKQDKKCQSKTKFKKLTRKKTPNNNNKCGVQLCWAITSEHRAVLECHWYAQGHSTRENRFSLFSGWYPTPHFSFSVPDPIWLLEPVHVLCMLPQSLWVPVYICPVVSGRHYFSKVINHLWLSKSFLLLFHIDLWALGMGEDAWWRHPMKEWVL